MNNEETSVEGIVEEPRMSIRLSTVQPSFFEKVVAPLFKTPQFSGQFMDTIVMVLDGDYGQNTLGFKTKGPNGAEQTFLGTFENFEFKVPTTFFSCEVGISCMVGPQAITLNIAEQLGDKWPEFKNQIDYSNLAWGLSPTPEVAHLIENEKIAALTRKQNLKSQYPAASTDSFVIPTSQEIDILTRSACDGVKGKNWRNELIRGTRVWEIKGGSHRVDVFLDDPEIGDTLTSEAVETLTGAQDSDFPLTAFYIFGVLSPPEKLPENRLSGAWFDLNDIMKKIGWLSSKPSETEREELRKRLYEFIRFGSRAVITGQRTTPYRDPNTRTEISTRIQSAPWRIMEAKTPVLEHEGESSLAPVRVYLAMSKEWEKLLTDNNLAQYLPLGELLGAIAPNQVAGDWARSIGVYLARLWRIYPRETCAGTVNPTRRELLTHYTPKTKTVEDYAGINKPKRAVKYYREALNILLEKGLILPAGDAAHEITVEKMISQYSRQGWFSEWLDGGSGLLPGDNWRPTIEKRAASLPAQKPRDLKAKPARRRKGKIE